MADEFPRFDPPRTGSERQLLEAYLDFQRATICQKAAGVDAAGQAATVGASTLTLGGLVKHLTLVEDSWFTWRFKGEPESAPWDSVDWDADPDWEFRTGAQDDLEAMLTAYKAACQRSRVITAESSLDTLSQWAPDEEGPVSLRWILLHMIEETARHAGHADLLREAVDGVVGD